jgi:phosphatidylserine/phosphatidylglycerophosphate/cardiolipin synthase-like enzyme
MKKKTQRLLWSLLVLLLTAILTWTAETSFQPTLPVSDQPVLFYSTPNRDDLAENFTKAIQEAKQSVLLIVYSLTDTKIIHALNSKSASKIPVKVICDGKTVPYIERKLAPEITLLRRFGPGIMHQKILVIDGRQVWIGSANMTGESLNLHANLVTGMESPALAHMIAEKADSFEEVGCNSYKLPHRDFSIAGQKLEAWFLPDDAKAVSRIKALIETAQKSLRIAMFTWTRRDLAEAVCSAHKRGVKVEVLLDYHSSQGASSKIMKFLLQKGIPVQVSQGNGLLHHKFLLVDGKTLVNGSANWTRAAFTQNDDCFIVLHELNDPQIQQLDALWTALKQESIPSK